LAVIYSILIATALISLVRYCVRRFLEWLHRKGISIEWALIYGAGYHGQRLERWIRQSPKLGIRVIGYLDENLGSLLKKPVHPPCLGGFSELKKCVQDKGVSILFVAHRKIEDSKIREIIRSCRRLKIQCWVIPSMYEFQAERAEWTQIGGIPLVGFREGYALRPYAFVKRFFDFLVSLLLGVVFAPFWMLIPIGIRVTSRGPILFKQWRVGQGGRRFQMIKFRTLSPKSKPQALSPELARTPLKADSRFGEFLRRTGLDEWPQLFGL
jgi:hypothetical protein